MVLTQTQVKKDIMRRANIMRGVTGLSQSITTKFAHRANDLPVVWIKAEKKDGTVVRRLAIKQTLKRGKGGVLLYMDCDRGGWRSLRPELVQKI